MEMALEQQTMSTQFAIDVFKATFEVLGQELVQSFLPVIRLVLGAFVDLAKMFVGLPQPVKDFMGVTIAMFGVIMSGVGAFALFLALFKPILLLLTLVSGAALAASLAFAALFAIFTKFGFRDVIQGFSDMVDMLDIPFLDHFTNSIERAAEAWDRFTGLIQTGTGFTQLDGFALSIGKLGAALIAFAESTSDLDFLDGPLGDLGEFFKDIAGPIDKFLDLWGKLEDEGTQHDQGGDYLGGGMFTGEWEKKRLSIASFALAWEGMVDSLHEEFPNQAPLINSLNGAVMGLVGTVSAAMAGDWDTAWASFKASMSSALEFGSIVFDNIVDSVSAIDWGAVADSIGGALDSAFAGITQVIDWVAYVAVPEVLGWLSENAGNIWGGIKAILGFAADASLWAAERATEVINWIIEVAVPEVIGYGKYVMGNLKSWLIGQLGGTGFHTRSLDNAGGTGELGEMSLGTLIVKWFVDIAIPSVTNAISGSIKGFLIGQILGSTGGGWASGSVSGAGNAGELGEMDLGSLAIKWAVEVLEPNVVSWVTDIAGWIQGKLQGYVNGATGGGPGTNGMPTAGGAPIGGGSTSGMVQLANWTIGVLEPIVNMQAGDITAWVQKQVTAAGSIQAWIKEVIYSTDTYNEAPGESIGEKIKNKVKADYEGLVTIVDAAVDVYLGLRNLGFGTSGGGVGAGGPLSGMGGLMGLPPGFTAMVQSHFSEPMNVNQIVDIVFALFDASFVDLAEIAEIIDGVRIGWEKADKWIKSVELDLDFLLPEVPQFITDIANFLDSLPVSTAESEMFIALVRGWEDVTGAAEDATAAQQEAAAAATTGLTGAPPDRHAGGMFAEAQTPSEGSGLGIPADNIDWDEEEGSGRKLAMPTPDIGSWMRGVMQSWGQGASGFQQRVQQTGKEVLTGFQTTLGTNLPRTTFTAAQDTSRQFGTGLTGMGQAATRESGQANTAMGTGLLGMVGSAGSQAVATTGALGTGLAGMAPASNLAGVGAESSLRNGIAPMPITATAAGRDATSGMGRGLAPMPGTVGGIATATGSSFEVGITTGFVNAAIAAQIGAAAISAAANSIGDLYSVGYGVGSSLGAGVADGIWAQVGAVAAASAALASAAAAGAQARGQISSPSRLMFNEVGVPLAEGVIAGIESRTPAVNAAMARVVGAFDGRTGAYTLPKSKVIAINNNSYYILEPEAWMEVQRDSKMAASQLRDLNSQARQRTRSKPQLSKTT
jgi:hypothetical protein